MLLNPVTANICKAENTKDREAYSRTCAHALDQHSYSGSKAHYRAACVKSSRRGTERTALLVQRNKSERNVGEGVRGGVFEEKSMQSFKILIQKKILGP